MKAKTKLIIAELGSGTLLMVLTQIQGYLPSQDWLGPAMVKKSSFIIAVIISAIKGIEMFFSKTSALYSNGNGSNDSTETPNPSKTNETKTPPSVNPGVVGNPR